MNLATSEFKFNPLEGYAISFEKNKRGGVDFLVRCTFEGEDYILELPMKKIPNDRKEDS